MICMYVQVHEKRNDFEYKVHQYHGMKMKVKIFNPKDKLHRKRSIPKVYLHIYNSFDFCQPKK